MMERAFPCPCMSRVALSAETDVQKSNRAVKLLFKRFPSSPGLPLESGHRATFGTPARDQHRPSMKLLRGLPAPTGEREHRPRIAARRLKGFPSGACTTAERTG